MVQQKMLISEAKAEYHDQMARRNRKPNTLRSDDNAITLLIRSVGDIQTRNITKDHIEKMFYGKNGLMAPHAIMQPGRNTNKGVSEQTHNHYRSRLKTFFDWMANRELMSRRVVTECFDKISGVVTPMSVPKKRRQRPAPVVLLSLLDAAENPRDRAWIAMALNTALRANEMARMLYGDLSLADGYVEATISKTGEHDDMPITSDLDSELRRWIIQYQADLGRPLEPDDYLFPARSRGMLRGCYVDEETGKRVTLREPFVWYPKKPMGRTEAIVQRALDNVGLETKYEGTHTLRRAVARAYFEMASEAKGDSAALRETAALLHHASTATTERYLGTDMDKNKRNRRMANQPFLSALVDHDNVVPLRPTSEGE